MENNDIPNSTNNNNNNNGQESRNNGNYTFGTILESSTSISSNNNSSPATIMSSRSSVHSRSSSYHMQHLKSAYGASEEMLETEKASLVERVNDLERIVLEQKDEIVCLKSTLADVLRRLNTIDNSHDNGKMMEGGSPSSSVMSSKSYRFSRNTVTRLNSSVEEKRFGRVPSRVTNSPSRNMSTSKASSLAQKAIHHSNGSLHSDSMSSHSISPAPSPSPRQPNIQNLAASSAGIGASMGPAGAAVGGMGKRWSSTGDFVSGSPGPMVNSTSNSISRFSTKSLLNLNSTVSGSGSKQTHTHAFVQRKDDDEHLKLYINGRPIVLHIPTAQINSYEMTKVQPAPNRRLRLDWVYGYRGKDCRSNLYQLPTGEMVYFVAAVVILYNMDEQSQRHYVGHTDDVKSLAVHPNKLLVATGQCGGHDSRETWPHVRVWNSVSLATLNVIGMGDFTGAINCLSFSRADNGTILAAIDDSPDKIISIWDWQKKENGKRITETKCSVDTIVAVEFHPLDKGQIITIGKNHIAFWSLDQNGMLYKRMGVFENREKPKYVTTITFTPTGDVVTGDSNGNISIWARGTNVINRFLKKVHEGSIFSICSLRNGGFVSGGKDGRLVLLDDLMRLKAEQLVEAHFGAVRIVAQGKGSQLLIGTTKNCILSGDFTLGLVPIVMGHTDILWSLAAHPQVAQFVTGGRDRLLQLWDSLSHSVVWSKDIGEPIQSVQFSNIGDAIIVGGVSGRWMVFDTVTRELLAVYQDGQDIIQTIKFSPDGNLLALGSKDSYIYIYQCTKVMHRFSKIGKCSGHSSYISHMDWSKDSQVLRSNSGDYELLYWNPTLCRQITNQATVRNLEWATQSCTVCFETVGIWPENFDGTDINSVGKDSSEQFLVAADDTGKIRLFSYPASQPKSLSHSYRGHSSHVTSVKFMHDGVRLLSAGGFDTSVLQWRVV
ncbi:echinoderm microtubule-associated protein-like 2 isoform X1 [Malaya genurostris]|uniref:echinoderm microtubule-associated protein-like 2 isoform X1 n=1 Tax=Malaya genurostris TaxID=325434 RepID=UPI0026F3FFEE|nr:echinoderm microtubule-associated protein-like 2 isoform X1 [Malaya genurostris]XP_058462137.1 echinoderm microtubule-associated protein-like 2 isoform X1 [Malaya genurostris]XP_058462138.1 echinoderm microtubule-associated protein-like 2 isoform X1 [Malaya genurostris]XP_058462139.1 echinoderm microtubule-associated protein-like 2 isoform X1 [Malaya genurostris]XP_058462140.1 echinoderm microtubule-associated protein-like 2 isoform X1 [Malaya genurostris]XP_058462141.1 echinoderm microtubu